MFVQAEGYLVGWLSCHQLFYPRDDSHYPQHVLNPNEQESPHIAAAHAYDRPNNNARMFGTIECWSANAIEEASTSKLFDLVDRKNKLNQDCRQIPPWAWKKAQERIAKDATTYVDKAKSSAPPAEIPPVGPRPAAFLQAWRQEIFKLSQETNFSQRVNCFTDRNTRLRYLREAAPAGRNFRL